MVELLKKVLPEDLWKEFTEGPPPDPWEEQAKKPTHRTRSKAEPLSALAALAPRPVISEAELADRQASMEPRQDRRETLRFKLQFVALNEQSEVVSTLDLARLDKGYRQIEQLGLTLSESKQILGELQQNSRRSNASGEMWHLVTELLLLGLVAAPKTC